MTTLLVTGGAGFIGANLIRHLLANSDASVVNVDALTYAGNLDSLEEVQENPRYIFSHTDIVDAQAVKAVFAKYRPDAIVHLAAESHVDRSIASPAPFIQTNIVGTYNLLEASRILLESMPPTQQAGFRFLHVSSDEVYGSLGTEDPAFIESTRYDPSSPYSASKASSDHLVRAWGRTFGLPALITNCSNNYGPFQFPEKLVPVVILNALRGRSIPIYGTGGNVRDWLYVEDHCAALSRVLRDGIPGETYNLGGNQELSNHQLAIMICRTLDELLPADRNPNLDANQRVIRSYESLIEFVTDRPGHDWRYAMDTTKVREQLGWTAEHRLAGGLRKTVQWYLDHPTWWQRIESGAYQAR